MERSERRSLLAELESVSVMYDAEDRPTVALNNVDFVVPRESVIAVLGRSGSGKSTLLSVLALLRTPNSGRVLIGGRDVSTLADRDRAHLRGTEIGMVFQSFHLEPTLTAAQNVMLPWYTGAFRGSRGSANARVTELLRALGIAELAGRYRDEMSGGQRQRVAIARALFTHPSLLLADEPTGNLDESTADQVAALLARLPEDFGTAVVVMTHDTAVAAIADRQFEIAAGSLLTADASGAGDRR